MTTSTIHQKSAVGLGVLMTGMAIGAGLGVLFAPQKGKDTQKFLLKKGRALKEKFQSGSEELKEKLTDIFGEVTAEVENSYAELQDYVAEKVEQIKESADLTQRKYNEIVQEAVHEYSKGKNWTKDSIRKLSENLRESWNDFSNSDQE
jgi:gas vesicle protein